MHKIMQIQVEGVTVKDLSNHGHGMIVNARWSGISETVQLLGFSCTTVAGVYTELDDRGRT